MAYLCLNQCFDLLNAEVDAFLVSDNANTIVYDNAALVKIIRNKELINICNATSATTEKFDIIYKKLGSMVSEISRVAQADALNTYYEIDNQINCSFDGLFHLYAKQTALSVKALLFYKLSSHVEALAATQECIALNDILVKNGMHSLLYRCIEQNKNIARIYQKQGMQTISDTLLKTIFHFLFNGQIDECLIQGSVGIYRQLWKKMPTLRESYTYELFRITVEDSLRNSTSKQAAFKEAWFNEIELDVTTSDRQVIYNWIYINNKLKENNFEEYIESVIYFMKQPINFFYDSLKIYLIHDLCALISNSTYDYKEILISKLISFVNDKVCVKRNYLKLFNY